MPKRSMSGMTAVVAGADRDAFQIELGADVEGRQRRIVDDEGDDRRLVRRRADDADAGNVAEALGGIVQQMLLVGGDRVAGRSPRRNRGPRPGRWPRRWRRAGLELVGQLVVGRLLEAHRANHVAAALVGRHQLQVLRPCRKARRCRSGRKSCGRRRRRNRNPDPAHRRADAAPPGRRRAAPECRGDGPAR